MLASGTGAQTASSIPRHRILTEIDVWLGALVTAVALFFRFWRIGQVPPGLDFDEAFESLEAHRILTVPGYHPVFFAGNNGVPPVEPYLTALAYRLFGEQTLASRCVSALVGTLTVLVVYVLMRRLFPAVPTRGDGSDQKVGVFELDVRAWLPFGASLILAVLPWHTAFSRRGIEVALLPLWASLAVLFLWEGLASGKARYFVLSGLFWGSSLYTYQASPFLFGLLALFLCYCTLTESGFVRRYGLRLLLLALAAALVIVPLVLYGIHNPDTFLHRGGQVTLFTKGRGSETPLASLAGNVVRVARFFIAGGDAAIADNLPGSGPVPPVVAAAFLVGTIVALRRWRVRSYALMAIWFFWMLAPTLITEDAPSIRRAIGSVVPFVALTALGLAWLVGVSARLGQRLRRLQPAGRNLGKLAAYSGACLILAYTVVWGYQYYFLNWGTDQSLFYWFDQGLLDLGNYAAESPADTNLYYTAAGANSVVHLPLVWPLRQRDLRTFDGAQGFVLPPASTSQTLYLVKVAQIEQPFLPTLQAVYPTGQVVHEVRDWSNNVHSLVFAVAPNTPPRLQIGHPMTATFGNQVMLLGSDFPADSVRAGADLTLTLYWRSLTGPTAVGYTVFTHLLSRDAAGGATKVWSGHDAPPLLASYATTRWHKEETVIDRHTIAVPADAPPGRYELEVGLYAPDAGGARLPIAGSAGPADSLVVGVVTLQR